MRDGDLIGQRYRLHARLGRGGMGQVYRATDERLCRDVAVKLVDLSQTTDITVAPRFHREALATARLNHPGIVTIFDAGTENRIAYLVMELLPGATLADVLRAEGPLTERRAVTLARKAAAALVATHAIGVVHRDIKPANIMISGDDVKLLDFGIALAQLDSDTHLTAPATTMGTAAYMSPEQALGRRAGPASDVYALGGVLIAMLTGKPPYSGDNAIQVANRHLNDPVPEVRALRPGVAGTLADLIERMLAKDPDARPDTAVVAAALDHLESNPNADATSALPVSGAGQAMAAVLPAAGDPHAATAVLPAGADDASQATAVLGLGAEAATAVLGRSEPPAATAVLPTSQGLGASSLSGGEVASAAEVAGFAAVIPGAAALAPVAGAAGLAGVAGAAVGGLGAASAVVVGASAAAPGLVGRSGATSDGQPPGVQVRTPGPGADAPTQVLPSHGLLPSHGQRTVPPIGRAPATPSAAPVASTITGQIPPGGVTAHGAAAPWPTADALRSAEMTRIDTRPSGPPVADRDPRMFHDPRGGASRNSSAVAQATRIEPIPVSPRQGPDAMPRGYAFTPDATPGSAQRGGFAADQAGGAPLSTARFRTATTWIAVLIGATLIFATTFLLGTGLVTPALGVASTTTSRTVSPQLPALNLPSDLPGALTAVASTAVLHASLAGVDTAVALMPGQASSALQTQWDTASQQIRSGGDASAALDRFSARVDAAVADGTLGVVEAAGVRAALSVVRVQV
jgi:hypothetical protein